MDILQRWEIAFRSHFGSLVLILVAVLVLLAAAYFLLVIRQRRKDRFAYLFSRFYEDCFQKMADFKNVGTPRADFFGRKSFILNKYQKSGIALIPPPDLIDEGVLERWRLYLGASHQLQHPIFPQMLWGYGEDRLIVLEEGLSDSHGNILQSLRHLLLDGKLSLPEKERLLLMVAEGLADLHAIKAENGRPLFHGWLLPSSFFVALDPFGKVERFLLAYTGVSFALGSKKIHQRLQTLQEGRLTIEKFRARELMEEMVILSPEEMDINRWYQVGTASDFYQFGGLALKVLSGQYPSADVDWKKVPQFWRPFLQRCLQQDRNERPRDFLELRDWMEDPELALTYKERLSTMSKANLSEEDTLEDLPGMLRDWQEEKDKTSKGEKMCLQAMTAMQASNWRLAWQHLEKAIKADPSYAAAHVQMAIVLYELQKFEEAEKHYVEAKKLDPSLARSFRKHIALKI